MNMIPLNTFDQVAAHYAAVKPMRGKHKDDNVRPIGKRSRAWERIVKMDEDTYLLTDPHYGDPVFSFWGCSTSRKLLLAKSRSTLLLSYGGGIQMGPKPLPCAMQRVGGDNTTHAIASCTTSYRKAWSSA